MDDEVLFCGPHCLPTSPPHSHSHFSFVFGCFLFLSPFLSFLNFIGVVATLGTELK